MRVILPALESAWERAHQLALGLSDLAKGECQVIELDPDGGFGAVSDVDSVVIIHDEPTVHIRAFIDRAQDQLPEVPLVVVDVPDNGMIIADYMMDGVNSCLLTGHSIEDLLLALVTVQSERLYLPPAVQAKLLTQFVDLCRDFNQSFGSMSTSYGLDPLTDREREVLRLLEQDLSNREIAERLYLEVGTVKNHVHNILTKLDLPDRRAAATYHRYSHSYLTGNAAG